MASRPKVPAAKGTPGAGETYLAPAGTNGMGKPPKVKAPVRAKAGTSHPAGKTADTINEYRKQVASLEAKTAGW